MPRVGKTMDRKRILRIRAKDELAGLAVRILDQCADLYREPQHRQWAIDCAVGILREHKAKR